MLWFLKWLAPVFGKLAGAPIIDIVEKLVVDADLKQRLKAEISLKLMDSERAMIGASQAIVLAEQASENWLTRSWRPLLMFILMGFLLFFGIFLPLIELGLGHPLEIQPKLDAIPEPAWNLLTLGLGGYVGGRTMEKIASTWLARRESSGNAPAPRQPSARRKTRRR